MTQSQITENIKKVAGKWLNQQTNSISRRMKNVQTLIEYADKIAEKVFVPNNFNGRGGYEGRYEYREWIEDINTRHGIIQKITRAYYPIRVNKYDGKIGISHNGVITQDGDFWYYYLTL